MVSWWPRVGGTIARLAGVAAPPPSLRAFLDGSVLTREGLRAHAEPLAAVLLQAAARGPLASSDLQGDAAQEAWRRLWERAAQPEPLARSVRLELTSLLLNELRNAQRRVWRQPRSVGPVEPEAPATGRAWLPALPLVQLVVASLRLRLCRDAVATFALLGRLPPSDRRLLSLLLHGQSDEEQATEGGLSAVTFRSRKLRACQRAHALLEAAGWLLGDDA